MRVFFAIGSGDAVAALNDWDTGYRTPTETSRTFSGLSYDFIERAGYGAFAVSSNVRAASLRAGRIFAQNIPKPRIKWLGNASGFHIAQVLYGLKLSWLAFKFRADVAVVDSGSTHWFVLAFMKLLGISVIPNFHNVYRNLERSQGIVSRVIQHLDGAFFRLCVNDALGVSPACQRDFPERTHHVRWHIHYAQFAPSDFPDHGTKPPHPITRERPFVLMFAGRIEENKGVFDLVEIVKRLVERDSFVHMVVCGAGPALEGLQRRIGEARLDPLFEIKGKLAREELLAVYRQCHAVVVPTKLSFCEGLPLVCVEACLTRKPVVSSEISNAKEIFGPAMLVAKTDDIDSYVDCIEDLIRHQSSYELALEHTSQVSTRFIDPTKGLDAVLGQVIR